MTKELETIVKMLQMLISDYERMGYARPSVWDSARKAINTYHATERIRKNAK